MLFYETEGKFGDKDFKVTAKSLFLLDIGNSGYTEYDPADPELIKYLMSNPETLLQKKGHIHSHHNMDVFFSGTDNDELVDNCGFHNFYLSLIVNNRNEMCAKIAFKAKTHSENNIQLTFMDENGKETTRSMVNKKDDECIYAYKCNIIKDVEEVEEVFKGRLHEVRKVKLEKEAKKASEAASNQQTPRSKDWYNGQGWRQAGLFEDVKAQVKGGPERPYTRVDPRVHSMLTKLLSMDYLYEGSLHKIIKRMNDEFYPSEENYSPLDPSAPHLYYDAIEKKALDYYMDAFPEDRNLAKFEKVMSDAIGLLEMYEDECPELIANLIESIDLEIK